MQQHDASTASIRNAVVEFRDDGAGAQARVITFDVDLHTGDIVASPHGWLPPAKAIPAAIAFSRLRGGEPVYRLTGAVQFQADWRGYDIPRPPPLT